MAMQVAMLRGVNLGRNRRVAMADLRGLAEELGLEDVRTLLQSGNLIYRTRLPAPAAEMNLESSIARYLLLTTEVFVRTDKQLSAIFEENPLAREAKRDPARVHVMFCREKVKDLEVTGAKRERFVASGKEIFIYYPDGAGRSRLRFNIAGTSRNWNTVTKILNALA